MMVRRLRNGMLFKTSNKSGWGNMTALTLSNWHKVRHGDAFAQGWNQSVITCLVLERTDLIGNPDLRVPFTTDLWVQPGTEDRKVDVLWRKE